MGAKIARWLSSSWIDGSLDASGRPLIDMLAPKYDGLPRSLGLRSAFALRSAFTIA
jgi:hypothetical protein